MKTENRFSAEFLMTALHSTEHTFKVAILTEVTAGKPFVKKNGSPMSADIAGIIGVVCKHFAGTLILAFPEKTYLKVMSRMLQNECKEMNPEIEDGAAEILNMILGYSKTTLNEKGFGIQQAIPSVVRGNELEFSTKTPEPSVVIQYTSELGDFFLELATRTPGAAE